VLLKLKARGMNIPELAIGDGAMGFWAALEEVYPETRQQRWRMQKRPSTCSLKRMIRNIRRPPSVYRKITRS
jgi:hypothetical protein